MLTQLSACLTCDLEGPLPPCSKGEMKSSPGKKYSDLSVRLGSRGGAGTGTLRISSPVWLPGLWQVNYSGLQLPNCHNNSLLSHSRMGMDRREANSSYIYD